MRVLALGINYSPDQTGIAPFTTGRCEYLAARGHQVRVCTGFPYYPAWRVRDADRGRLFAREAVNGVTVLRSYAYVPRRVTAARRILHEASFVASASLRALIGPRPDVLFVVSPPLGLALPADRTSVASALWRLRSLALAGPHGAPGLMCASRVLHHSRAASARQSAPARPEPLG